MARRRAHAPLNVWLNGRLVGRLEREARGGIAFGYASEWLGWAHCFPISLSLPLREEIYAGAVVFAVFDNLLPDSPLIRGRVAERTGAVGSDAYSLLSAVGRDCVGALQFLAADVEPGPPGTVEGVPLDEEDLARLIRNLDVAPLGLGPDRDFRISIAGAQEKTALLRRDGRWFKPHGTTATTHILKPQIGRLPNGIDLTDSVENEYLCLKLMEALGLPVPAVEIATFGERRVLVVERFDRRWTADGRLLRLPQEDMCQALSIPPSRKYQSDGGPGAVAIAGLLKGSDEPERDIALFLRALVVFWLLGATDGHAKNVSIFLGPGAGFRLTPFYDVLTAQPSADARLIEAKQYRMAMSLGTRAHWRMDEIMPRHFRQTAERAGIGRAVMPEILADLAERGGNWSRAAVAALPRDFPERLVASTMNGLELRLRRLQDEADAGGADAGGP